MATHIALTSLIEEQSQFYRARNSFVLDLFKGSVEDLYQIRAKANDIKNKIDQQLKLANESLQFISRISQQNLETHSSIVSLNKTYFSDIRSTSLRDLLTCKHLLDEIEDYLNKLAI